MPTSVSDSRRDDLDDESSFQSSCRLALLMPMERDRMPEQHNEYRMPEVSIVFFSMERPKLLVEVYVVSAIGNDGADGLHTVASPAISSGSIAVAAVDNSYTTQFYLLTPEGEKIVYLPGVKFGGWRSIVPSIVIVNGLFSLNRFHLIILVRIRSSSYG